MTTFVHASLTAAPRRPAQPLSYLGPRRTSALRCACPRSPAPRPAPVARAPPPTARQRRRGAVRSPAWPAQATSRCRPVSTLVEAREFGAELRVLLPQRCGTPAHARKRLREPVDRERVLCARHAHTGEFTGVAIGPPARIGRLGESNVWPHMGLPPDPFGGLAVLPGRSAKSAL